MIDLVNLYEIYDQNYNDYQGVVITSDTISKLKAMIMLHGGMVNLNSMYLHNLFNVPTA